ncbi:Cupredoxin [Mycena capillaripes]|nr:Cupredoxin [Mycena capillaripes]
MDNYEEQAFPDHIPRHERHGLQVQTLALLPFIIGRVLAADLFFDLPITNATVAPDGFPRQAIQAGSFPGTNILASKGDVLHINVTMNQLDPAMRRSTSIHWHGLFQSQTGSEDGPSFVNQCPIANGQFYQYNIPLRNQTGTFWFHSHLSTQYVDGERGTLVIYPDDPLMDLYDVDNEQTIITLADWYHTPAAQLMDQYKLDGVTPVPSAGLINGAGRYVGGPEVPYAVITVEQGKRYRFRVIDIAGYGAFVFSIDGHVFDVIETDGIETVPLTVSSFEIYVAQRYSIILNADQPVDNYWIRAPIDVQGNNPDLDPSLVKAILRYAGAPDAEPVTSALVPPVPLKGGGGGGGSGSGGAVGAVDRWARFRSFNSRLATVAVLFHVRLTTPQTLVDPGAPGGDAPADHRLNLTFASPGDGVWEINGEGTSCISWRETLTVRRSLRATYAPDASQDHQRASVASDFNTSEHTFILNLNEVVELEIHGSDLGITHPFHLHGHAFDIVKSASGPSTTPRRDVIGVQQGGVVIRFRADNPGPWFLHCHIDCIWSNMPSYRRSITDDFHPIELDWPSYSLKILPNNAWVMRPKSFPRSG